SGTVANPAFSSKRCTTGSACSTSSDTGNGGGALDAGEGVIAGGAAPGAIPLRNAARSPGPGGSKTTRNVRAVVGGTAVVFWLNAPATIGATVLNVLPSSLDSRCAFW